MERARRKTRVGVVISDKMQKTVVVKVETTTRHPLYGKTMRKVKKYKAHDERSEAREGDKVLIADTRPLSKEKRWRVVQVLEKAR
ncbi:MAG: 30S ribosomal protein S17 [Armatimonadetes bacterium]|nr:30S ribosomal protein S17 [Armatimonadota bacterium]MBI2200860.1 30S ribosomal protein S17 [Armatimonadota bacterium]MBI2247474.1 30S ribosomal protein S17 [Armatimonadota bacterium]MBI2973395.1 30S ribosomal protein S17 [Armatimonadota bacterium]